MTISKSRIAALADKVIDKPGEELGKKLRAWLSEGEVAPERPIPMSEETRVRVQDAVAQAKNRPEASEQYAKASDSLKATGYKSWSAFLTKATEIEALAILAVLDGAPVVVG